MGLSSLIPALAFPFSLISITRFYGFTETQSRNLHASAFLPLTSLAETSFKVFTAAGCIIINKSTPASSNVKAEVTSHNGPLNSRGSHSGAIFNQASRAAQAFVVPDDMGRSEEHTSELQSHL